MGKNKNKNKASYKNIKKMSYAEKLELVLRPLSDAQMESLTKEELLVLLRGEQKIRVHYEGLLEGQIELNKQMQDKQLELEGKLVNIRCRIWNPKSERSKREKSTNSENTPKRIPLAKNRNLEERYPDAEVIEKEVRLDVLPECPCCRGEMSEMNLFEQSQYLTVIPQKYLITNVLRMKYHCSKCHGHITTTPQLPRIIPRSPYGDEFIIDLVNSKYCDLIPAERYCEIAARKGFAGLPSNSMYDLIWKHAMFLRPLYELSRIETLDSFILLGDETPHKMLEGEDAGRWYLWGFFSASSCFFECHNSRAGEIAADILSESGCSYFMSDAYSGYSKGIREANDLRKSAELLPIIEVNCNAHARRYFHESGTSSKEDPVNKDVDYIIAEYKVIYNEDKEVQKLITADFEKAKEKRAALSANFENIKTKVESDIERYSSHNNYYKACQYFLNNYAGLTACLKDPRIPLDNNQSERGLRPAVVGRKTWYGTHSEKGAEAGAIHFTLIESCKMNNVNPREYYKAMTEAIHYKRLLMTPSQYSANLAKEAVKAALDKSSQQ